MLQQTTVATVGPYFQKFIKRWPCVRTLARARREDVLREWAGLGYYRRAHALHEAAKKVCSGFDGHFPSTEDELRTLPGCGPYTAAAIVAIAFDRRANVVDGNVERVMARLFAVQEPLPKAKPLLKDLAASLLPRGRCGDYAQALMDLGATICTPRGPKCALCPLVKVCKAYKADLADALPLRKPKDTKPVRRAIAFFITNGKGSVLIRRRPVKGLLGGMMEIPTSDWRISPMPLLSGVRCQAPVRASWTMLPGMIRHVFSHFTLELSVAVATSSTRGKGKWVMPSQLDREALPSVMRKIVRHAQTFNK